MTENVLYYGDNLVVLGKDIYDNSVDLVYLDPPFNSKANYNVLFGSNGGSQAQIRAFDDTWHWGPESARSYADIMEVGGRAADMLEAFHRFLGENDMMAYLTMMTPRLIELRRVLKDTGTLYLHCDPTASHYLKILMDAVFGTRHFLNELIWYYRGAGTPRQTRAKRHDVLLVYAKNNGSHYFDPDPIRRPYAKATVERFKHHIGNVRGGHDFGIQELNPLGKHPDDVITDIQPIAPSARDRLGYPTQKPLTLLEEIIKSSSKEGDLVLDPFCGCGTTIHAAQKHNRQWVGIDITHLAIGLIEYRLRDAFGIRPKVIGAPEDLAGAHDLFKRNPFQFEAWAVTRLLGIKPNEKQVGDRGIDGVGRFYLGRGENGREQYGKILVSVKGGERLGVAMIRDFRGAMEREKADLGVFISLHKPTRAMITEAASAGRYRDMEDHDFPRIQIHTIKDHFEGKRLDLPPTIEEARRRAKAEGGEQPDLL